MSKEDIGELALAFLIGLLFAAVMVGLNTL